MRDTPAGRLERVRFEYGNYFLLRLQPRLFPSAGVLLVLFLDPAGGRRYWTKPMARTTTTTSSRTRLRGFYRSRRRRQFLPLRGKRGRNWTAKLRRRAAPALPKWSIPRPPAETKSPRGGRNVHRGDDRARGGERDREIKMRKELRKML